MPAKFLKLGFSGNVLNENGFYNVKVNDKIVGFNLDLKQNYYRGHHLSCIEKLEVKVDGKLMSEDIMLFCLNGKKFAIRDLKKLFAEFWGIKSTANLIVYNGGLPAGEHNVDVTLIIRCPSMYFGPGHYGMIDSSCSKTMVIKG